VNISFIVWSDGRTGMSFVFAADEPLDASLPCNAGPELLDNKIATSISAAIGTNQDLQAQELEVVPGE
jgi:hypothetical protein